MNRHERRLADKEARQSATLAEHGYPFELDHARDVRDGKYFQGHTIFAAYFTKSKKKRRK